MNPGTKVRCTFPSGWSIIGTVLNVITVTGRDPAQPPQTSYTVVYHGNWAHEVFESTNVTKL